jgi:hypothetical protein
VKLYGSELVVYDKHNRCLLTDGDYELGLQEVQTSVRSSPKKYSSWETIPSVKDCGPFDVFGRGPTLKFRLNWTTEPSNGYVDRPPPVNPLPSADNKENRPGNSKSPPLILFQRRSQDSILLLYKGNGSFISVIDTTTITISLAQNIIRRCFLFFFFFFFSLFTNLKF